MAKTFLVLMLLIARTAAADEPTTPNVVAPPAPFPTSNPVPITPEDPVSERTALWLSVGGTLGAYGLFAGGAALGSRSDVARGVAVIGGFAVIVAPSFGHWYAGRIGTRGMAVRAAAVPVALITLLIGIAPGSTASREFHRNLLIGGMSIAGGMWVAGTVDDLIQAPVEARHRNARIKLMQPYLAPTGAGVTIKF